jgi:hypothetical protein
VAACRDDQRGGIVATVSLTGRRAWRKPAPSLTRAGITEKALSEIPRRRRHVLLSTYSHEMSREAAGL